MSPCVLLPLALLKALPDRQGFAGMFAGVSGGALLCAGGANFPVKPLRDGGAKTWHDRVYVLDQPGGRWREAGRLPRASGYGVSATWHDAVILAGGGDAAANFHEVLLMHWDGTRLSFASLPPLPVATANGSGAIVGNTLYIAGGQETPAAASTLRRCFALDLGSAAPRWREIPWPAAAPGRILAVAAALDGWFYLFSGADLQAGPGGRPERRYLADAWRYRPADGWQRLANLPHAAAAAPSPAAEVDGGRLLIVGGVSPEFLAEAPNLSAPRGFPGGFLAYDSLSNAWTEIDPPRPAAGAIPPRVTAPLVAWQGLFVVPSGEISPGIRTPTVLAFRVAP